MKDENESPSPSQISVAGSRAAPSTKRPNGAPAGNKNAQRLGPLVKAAIDLLYGTPGLTVLAACEQAQCPRRTFYKAINRPAARTYIGSLIEQRRRSLGIIEADHVLSHLLLKGESEYVRADIAKDILAQEGVRKRLDGAQRQAPTGGIRISFITSGQANGAQAVQIDIGAEEKRDDAEG